MGWRSETIFYEDTLQALSLRHLGHAKYWLDIVALNDLIPPYLAAKASRGVLAYGSAILLPVYQPDSIARVDDPFLTDTYLDYDGQLVIDDNGDLATVSGTANLKQALDIRVVVEKKTLLFHPEYGCYVPALVGRINRPSLGQLAAFYVRSALLEDPRVKQVTQLSAIVSGDQIIIHVTVQPHYGEAIAYDVVV